MLCPILCIHLGSIFYWLFLFVSFFLAVIAIFTGITVTATAPCGWLFPPFALVCLPADQLRDFVGVQLTPYPKCVLVCTCGGLCSFGLDDFFSSQPSAVYYVNKAGEVCNVWILTLYNIFRWKSWLSHSVWHANCFHDCREEAVWNWKMRRQYFISGLEYG